jgi:Uncharacterized conserved protein
MHPSAAVDGASKGDTGMSLSRFLEAQADLGAGYAAALCEIRAAGKRGHWMWYIFPQLTGLGSSANARYCGLANVAEARAYLDHPLLADRLVEISEAVVDRVGTGVDLASLMNSVVDVRKLGSCMTLFAGVAVGHGKWIQLHRVASYIVGAVHSRGIPPCRFTLDALAQQER